MHISHRLEKYTSLIISSFLYVILRKSFNYLLIENSLYKDHVQIAQLAEHQTFNMKAQSSSPCPGAKINWGKKKKTFLLVQLLSRIPTVDPLQGGEDSIPCPGTRSPHAVQSSSTTSPDPPKRPSHCYLKLEARPGINLILLHHTIDFQTSWLACF